jgi:hypothetical protein
MPAGSWWERSMDRTAWRTLLAGGGLFAVFVAFLAAVQFATPSLVGNDGYYHIKLAYLMRTEGLRPTFNWLPLTVLNAEEFVDHHFFYHVLLMPFTYGDLTQGAKTASVIFAALTFLAIWWLLRGQRVPHAGLWSLGLLVISEAFLYRMGMPRAQSLSLAAMVLAVHWLLTDRHRLLLPLAFLYVWLYNAFPLIVLVTAAYLAGRWLVERRLAWRPLVYTTLGISLGLVINPYFPDNLVFITRHLMPKLGDATATNVGSEWYPYNTTQLMENSGLALIALLAGVMALGLQSQRMNTATATSFFLTVLFGAMLFKSRRFVEYFPAYALIFAAMAWKPLIAAWLKGGTWHSTSGLPGNALMVRLERLTSRPGWRSWAMRIIMLAVLLPTLWLNLNASRSSAQDSTPYQRYADAAAWLQKNTPAGARVFQTDWDDFTRLFFYNTHNTYTLGLDPTYMQLYDPELYDLWVDISQGRVTQPSEAISQTFGAHYVLTDLGHEKFLRKAADDPGLAEVYRDGDAAIFQFVAPGTKLESDNP